MIEVFPAGIVTPNTKKGNEAVDLNRIDRVAEAAGFVIVERTLLTFGPHGWGGNHKHKRQELMIVTSGNPTLVHKDEGGNRMETPMGRDAEGQLKAFFVPSWEPHLVVNNGEEPCTIYELRDLISTEWANLEGAEDLFLEEQIN